MSVISNAPRQMGVAAYLGDVEGERTEPGTARGAADLRQLVSFGALCLARSHPKTDQDDGFGGAAATAVQLFAEGDLQRHGGGRLQLCCEIKEEAWLVTEVGKVEMPAGGGEVVRCPLAVSSGRDGMRF